MRVTTIRQVCAMRAPANVLTPDAAHAVLKRMDGHPMANVRILLNNNVRMSPGKAAAQAVHAALLAYGIEHGSVVVLQGSKVKIEAMDVQVRDAGLTELKPGTLTAGASLEKAEGRDVGAGDQTTDSGGGG